MSPVQTVGSMSELPWNEVQTYLDHYGYLESQAKAADGMAKSTTSPEPPVAAALRRFQEFHGVRGSNEAELAQSILKAVRSPRCGVRDMLAGQIRPPGCPWSARQNVLIYEVANGPEGLELEDVADAILSATNSWNSFLDDAGIQLSFRRREEGEANLHVRFSWEPVGAEVNALISTPVAHADFPPGCGLRSQTLPRPVIFNSARSWATEPTPERLNIVAVAVHELGHILGLPHSDDRTSVMFPDLLVDDEPAPIDLEDLTRLYRE